MTDADFLAEFAGVDGEAFASPDQLERLHKSLNEMIALSEMIEQMEEDLKQAKKAKLHLERNVCPEIMAELQMEATIYRGWDVKVKNFFSGSLPKDANGKQRAIEYLTKIGASSIIKTTVAAKFDRGSYDEATQLYNRLAKVGHTATLDTSVHPQTLASFAREKVENGEPIDLDVIGVYSGKTIKAQRVKTD